MSDETDKGEPGALRDSLGYPRNLDQSDVSPFVRAVQELAPGASGSGIAALLGNRISRQLASHWLAGRRAPAPWALELLAAKLRAHAAVRTAIAAQLETLPPRPERRSSAKNLAAWKARQAKLNDKP